MTRNQLKATEFLVVRVPKIWMWKCLVQGSQTKIALRAKWKLVK